jgi:streptogramin lyase
MRSGRVAVALSLLIATLIATLFAAPPQAASAAPAAASPSISPAAEHSEHVARDKFAEYPCPAGRACFAVWDDNTNNWLVFNLFRCGLYSVFNWRGGGLRNN